LNKCYKEKIKKFKQSWFGYSDVSASSAASALVFSAGPEVDGSDSAAPTLSWLSCIDSKLLSSLLLLELDFLLEFVELITNIGTKKYNKVYKMYY
jgi:hypothetical protein